MKNQKHDFTPSPPILDNNTVTGRMIETGHKPWWLMTNQDKRERKYKRAYQRFMLGVGMPGEYLLITFTTPPEFKGGLNRAWRMLVKRMRRYGIPCEYYAVKEWNKNHNCQHLHVVLRLDSINYDWVRQQWNDITGAVWIHVDKVKSAKGMANYLGKYLNKAYNDEPGKRSYWYAYEWIYPKWRGFSNSMFKLGESITPIEHELIHGINEKKQRLDYMNWRLRGATLHAFRVGIIVKELVQF